MYLEVSGRIVDERFLLARSLLQRVESFGGVVILTTNLDTSIDPALRR